MNKKYTVYLNCNITLVSSPYSEIFSCLVKQCSLLFIQLGKVEVIVWYEKNKVIVN